MPEISQDLLNKINPILPNISSGGIREFDASISKIPDIIKLTLGEPDFDAPKKVKDAAIRSIEKNDSHYGPTRGTLELRQAVVGFLKRKYELDYSAKDEILITVGATEAIHITFSSILQQNDEVIIPTPTYPLYESDVISLGAVPINVNTQPDNFILTPEKLESVLNSHPNAKCMVFNYPSNPTGVTYSLEELTKLANVIKKHNIFVLSDEIYSELTYNQKHVSLARLIPEQTILISGASKAYAMTGYRIGLLAGPNRLVEQIAKVHQLEVTTHVNTAMAGATEAFSNCDIESLEMTKAYAKRQKYLVEELRKMNLVVARPNGAFYLFIKIPSQYELDDQKFANTLANEAKVALVPGSIFGPGGEGYVRLSYAASEKKLKEALIRIRKFVNNNLEV